MGKLKCFLGLTNLNIQRLNHGKGDLSLTVKVDLKKCNGCKQLDSPQCKKLCPGDLMQLNPDTKKAYINVEKDCWDCMVCVKACPMRAIETRLPYQVGGFGASLKPRIKA
jgi:adenylylsulfate reductase subunit B